jgi:penicillin-binding protein 1B
MYANRGIVSKPAWIKTIRTGRGTTIFESQPNHKPVLDPRVDYLMVDLLQEVLRSGTGASVRGRGFKLPAAGKTGTSDHDGWFAGFTSKLLCVVWVGYDDNHDLNIEGAKSALPIWVEFMKRAHEHREYRAVHGWDAPDGIVSIDIDPATGQLATPMCPAARSEYFISGTQPVQVCSLHGGGTQVAGWETVPPKESPVPPRMSVPEPGGTYKTAQSAPQTTTPETPQPPAVEKPKEKRGFFGRIRDIFK